MTSSPDPLSKMSEVEYGMDSKLEQRMIGVLERRGLTIGEGYMNGSSVLHMWDRLRVMGQRVVNTKGLTILESGVIDPDTGIRIRELGKIAALVDVQKPEYSTYDTAQTASMSMDALLRLEAYALSNGYADLDPVFRDVALFFCNVHELIEQAAGPLHS